MRGVLATASAALKIVTDSPWYKIARTAATQRLVPPDLIVPPYDFEITIYAKKGDGPEGNRIWVHTTTASPLAQAQILMAALQSVTSANGMQIQAGPPAAQGGP